MRVVIAHTYFSSMLALSGVGQAGAKTSSPERSYDAGPRRWLNPFSPSGDRRRGCPPVRGRSVIGERATREISLPPIALRNASW